MPTYDFRCEDCRRPVSLFYKSFQAYAEAEEHICPYCGQPSLRRRIGRVAIAKSEDSRMDAVSDETFLDGFDENDPQSMGRFMRKMSAEMGEDLGDEFNEVVDRLEKGQAPEEIEKALPDLAGDGGGDVGGGDLD